MGGAQLLDIEGDRDRFTDRVSGRIQNTRGEMIRVEVDTENPQIRHFAPAHGAHAVLKVDAVTVVTVFVVPHDDSIVAVSMHLDRNCHSPRRSLSRSHHAGSRE